MAISRHMRDVLIEHIDGAVGIVRFCPEGGEKSLALAQRNQTIKSLVGRGLLRTDVGMQHARPSTTAITEAGRAVLAKELADWAEALVQAGYRVEEPERESRGQMAEVRTPCA